MPDGFHADICIRQSVCNIPDLWRDTDEPVAGFALNTWAFSAEIIVIAPIWSAYIYASLGWRWVVCVG
jgi:hypothetical protein